MERRTTRTTRLSTSTDIIPPETKTRRAPSRTNRVESPTRKSPSRRSPPARRSPARKVKMSPIPEARKVIRSTITTTTTSSSSTTTKSLVADSENTRGTNSMDKITESFNVPRTLSPSVSLRKLSPNYANLSLASKLSDKEKINPKLEDSGDAEVSKLTYNIDNLTPEPSQHSNLTPAISERTRRSVSRSLSRSVSQSVYDDEDSDQESQAANQYIQEKQREMSIKRSVPRQMMPQSEFGQFQSLLMFVLLPLVCLYLTYDCNAQLCTLKTQLTRNELTALFKPFFSLKLYLVFITFTWGIVFLSFNPFGRYVKFFTADRGYTEYNCNGFSTAILAISLIYGAEYYLLKFSLFKYILDHYMQFCVLNILYGIVLSVSHYIRSIYLESNAQLNPYGKTGHFLIDFFAGREINSKLFNILDIKLIRYRIYLITVLLFNVIYVTRTLSLPSVAGFFTETEKSYMEKILLFFLHITFEEVTLLISTMLIVYILDQLVNEHNFISSFEIQNEGVGGYLLMRYSVLPFVLNSIGKYAFDNDINEVPRWAFALIGLTFVAGIYLKRASDNLKYEFRLNPMNPKFLNIETIPTFQGKRLLCSGPWALMRHPNYLGEMIALAALMPILYWRFAWPPLISVLLIIVSLVCRTVRIESRNSKKYMSSYQRYCSRVRYNLVPKIY